MCVLVIFGVDSMELSMEIDTGHLFLWSVRLHISQKYRFLMYMNRTVFRGQEGVSPCVVPVPFHFRTSHDFCPPSFFSIPQISFAKFLYTAVNGLTRPPNFCGQDHYYHKVSWCSCDIWKVRTWLMWSLRKFQLALRALTWSPLDL